MLFKEQNKYQVYFLAKRKSRTLLKKLLLLELQQQKTQVTKLV